MSRVRNSNEKKTHTHLSCLNRSVPLLLIFPTPDITYSMKFKSIFPVP